MGRLASELARLGCAVAMMAVCGAVVGCFEPGMVPELWVPSHWGDPLIPLHGWNLSVWIIVPHGNPYATDKTRLAKRVTPQPPPPTSPAVFREQTVGSFGVSSTDLPEAMRTANGSKPPDPPPLVLQHDPRFDALEKRLQQHDFLRQRVTFKDEYEDDVEADLKKGLRPDVILGNPLPRAVAQEAGSVGLVTRWGEYSVEQTDGNFRPQESFSPQALLLGEHLSAAQARAFAIWLADPDARAYQAQTRESDAAAQVAERALCRYVLGGSMGRDADPEMARLPDHTIDLELLDGTGGNCSRRLESRRVSDFGQVVPGELRIDVVSAQAAENSATVRLRVSGVSDREAEVRSVLMVLRPDEALHWRVLQMSFDLARAQQLNAIAILARAGAESERVFRNEATLPLGILQASPTDGEGRSPQPDLWWDNLGGATLQVVEWQMSNAGSTYLYFVPDSANRLQTRVTARFAAAAGAYRWRVWSVGADGTIVISSWRTLRINSV